MTDKMVVLVTAGSAAQAGKIASRLVASRLAACVNIISSVHSVYWWKGRVARGRECLLVIKTRKRMLARLQDEVLKMHSYATPEIIAVPVVEGLPAYLRWIDESLKDGARKIKSSPAPGRGRQ